MKFAANLVALLIVLASGLTGSANAQSRADPFTERQREILRTVRSVDGYIDEKLHNEFWSHIPRSIREDPRLQTLSQNLLGEVGEARLEFQKQGWLSARDSLSAGKVVRTPGYVAAVEALRNVSANARFQDGVERSIIATERLLAAAAAGQPFELPDGPTFITEEVITEVLSGLDASEFRAKKLMAPVWDGTLVQFDYPEAHVSVLAISPYTLEWTDFETPETNPGKLAMLSQRRGPVTWGIISYLQTGARYSDARSSLTSIVRAGIESMGAIGRPPAFSKWRGMDSAAATGSARTSEGEVFVAIRVVEAPEIRGVLQFITTSELSVADALNELGNLEETIQIVP